LKKIVAAVALLLCLSAARPGLAQGKTFALDVHDADIYDVIRLLGSTADVNLVPEGSIKHDRVTLRLRDVTFDEALRALTEAFDLQTHREGSVVLIGPSAQMNRRYGVENGSTSIAVMPLRRAKADDIGKLLVDALPSGTVVVADKRTAAIVVTGGPSTLARARSLVSALDAPAFGAGSGGSLKSVALPLKYLKPSDAIKTIKTTFPEANLVADDRQNAAIVTGNEEAIAAVSALVAAIDVPGQQVMFEVRVADVTPTDDTSNVGIIFGGIDIKGNPASGSTVYTFVNRTITVNATLNLLVQKGSASILATPRLVTVNNHEASLLVGETFPIVYFDARTGTQQVQFTDIGVKLKLTPTIGSDGAITADLHPEYSQIVSFSNGFPVIGNRKVDSMLRVADGETIVLAGLLSDIRNQTITKIPGLGDIPILGRIFQNRQSSRTRDEIVFLITPHIVKTAADAAAP
jgi:type II secretory pathway component GspD/PulD (secretin)